MTRRFVLGALTLTSFLVLACCLIGGGIAELGFSVLAIGFPVLLMLLGVAGRDGRLGSPAWPIFALLVWLELCLLGMLALRSTVETGAWFLGLPAAAAIQLYGVFLAPLALVALGYALTFEAFGVSDDDLERLRGMSRREGDDQDR